MFSITLVLIPIILALIFDFTNGFQDTANAVATSVATQALSPRMAVILAAVFNFLGALSGTAVAITIGTSLVSPDLVTPIVIIAALSAAIFWNTFTWYLGIPSSASHALIGGIVGGVIAGYGVTQVKWLGFVKIFAGLIISPVVGFLVGGIFMAVFFWLFKNHSPLKTNNKFRKLQVLSACMVAFAHGSNDAQKSMGIITMVLFGAGIITVFEVPLWVKVACASAMALGTAQGGWRIIKTVGSKIFKIEPINGFASDFTSSIVIYSATLLGAPVSTTHIVSSSIVGAGTVKRAKGVRWQVAIQIIAAWVITIPSSAFVAIAMFEIISKLF
ncbi:putative low-affinity inorganic phosphate transporter [Candidatus Syntrophocurvum alkaliphilum]|uniref:Putative low-affinity inorganic phosphate transporter n=1 Tax=Candidatus Syntrophocurvum alkaliphilum TaxID=2293317 RepID=A0A6I6DIP8_9FIRM|nr:inorganic phosphate transporter [Candidatus Syntrophocurvum alkaliphilum]QGU00054.1 putative low-affinity inorganic phosphate transporter [Candidatus Syntrophocurvum alkaliphilum]